LPGSKYILSKLTYLIESLKLLEFIVISSCETAYICSLGHHEVNGFSHISINDIYYSLITNIFYLITFIATVLFKCLL
jgi:hypothetical protein